MARRLSIGPYSHVITSKSCSESVNIQSGNFPQARETSYEIVDVASDASVNA